MSRPCKYLLLKDQVWLYKKYIEERLSSIEIGLIVGCAPSTVISALKRRGIHNRSIKETAKRGRREFKKHELNDKKWIEQKYLIEKLSSQKIGKLIGVSETSVLNAIRYHKINTGHPIKEDLTGNIYNNWTVLKKIKKIKNNKIIDTYYMCRCICGRDKEVLRNNLIQGKSKSCGCINKEKIISSKINKIIGNLKIISLVKNNKEKTNKKQLWWRVLCLLCGSEKVMSTNAITNAKSCGCSHKKSKGESGFNALFHMYKRNALKRGLKFSLTREEFKNITKQNCYYCGKIPEQISSHGYNVVHSSYIYNGIDRLDNSEGYTLNNCVPCCGTHNLMKRELSYNSFVEHIKMIYDHLNIGCKNI